MPGYSQPMTFLRNRDCRSQHSVVLSPTLLVTIAKQIHLCQFSKEPNISYAVSTIASQIVQIS